jgi:hypothetical protein
VVWFSCGAASACAAKLAPQGASVVYCDTSSDEHPDNPRFLHDVETWIGRPVEIIRSEKYTSIDDVFERTRYMSGIKGARCTVEMKKVPRFEFQRADDIHVFGLTADEPKRIADLERNNPELHLSWVLRDAGMTKQKCYEMVAAAGIALPVMYSLGFKNNNCIGCVKATSPAYWNRVRTHFPDRFAKRAERSREIGVRLVRWKGERIFLDELPNDIGAFPRQYEEDIECGPVCQTSMELSA